MVEIVKELITLSKIFKEGFTCEIIEGKIRQYTNSDKPWIASHLTVVKIKDTQQTIEYCSINSIDDCIVGGWYEKESDTYYIEIGASFSFYKDAIKEAKAFNQKYIYSIITQRCYLVEKL